MRFLKTGFAAAAMVAYLLPVAAHADGNQGARIAKLQQKKDDARNVIDRIERKLDNGQGNSDKLMAKEAQARADIQNYKDKIEQIREHEGSN